MFTINPAFQACRAKLSSGVEVIRRVAHLCQWLPHLHIHTVYVCNLHLSLDCRLCIQVLVQHHLK